MLLSKLTDKISALYHRHYSSKKGYGLRVRPEVWEKQFRDRFWDYLKTDKEQGHYEAILNFYQEFGKGGKVLDVGCGQGVLYTYLQQVVPLGAYLGIDIAEAAIRQAQNNYPDVGFRKIDFEYESVDSKVDVIIFNETLYYFKQPMETLKKCVRENLKDGGIFIISMCDYGNHELIWKLIETTYTLKAQQRVNNGNGQVWYIKVFGFLQ